MRAMVVSHSPVKSREVVSGVFGVGPHVAELVHHQDAQAVAAIQQGLAGGVVGGADGVEAGLLQAAYPELLGVGQSGGADDAVIVVDAGAPELGLHAVDAQAATGVGGDGADAEGALGPVQLGAVFGEGGHPAVEAGAVRAPEGGGVHIELAVGADLRRGQEGDLVGEGGGLLAVRADQRQTELDGVSLQAGVAEQDLRGDHGVALLQALRGETDAGGLQRDQVPLPEDYVPVNAGAGVPAGLPLAAQGQHLEGVLLAVAQAAVQLGVELGIAVAVGGDKLPIEVHHGPGHDALELRHSALLAPILRGEEGLLIGVGLHRIEAGLAGAGAGRVPVLQNHFILGQGDGPGLWGVAEERPEGVRHPGLNGPVLVPVDLFHLHLLLIRAQEHDSTSGRE